MKVGENNDKIPYKQKVCLNLESHTINFMITVFYQSIKSGLLNPPVVDDNDT